MIKKVTPEKVNIKDRKTGEKNGKKWELYPVGIQVSGQWYNGAVFSKEDADQFQEGKEMILDFFKEEYQGKMYWKFKLPSRLDALEQRVSALESLVSTLSMAEMPEPVTGHPGHQVYDNPADIQSGMVDEVESDLPF